MSLLGGGGRWFGGGVGLRVEARSGGRPPLSTPSHNYRNIVKENRTAQEQSTRDTLNQK
jgi:hypothetical protein